MRSKIPTNVDEAIMCLQQVLSQSDLNILKAMPEEELYKYHHGLGRAIRNSWLWTDSSALKIHFKQMDVLHPDDMSSIIITSLHRKLNKKSINLDRQVERFTKVK